MAICPRFLDKLTLQTIADIGKALPISLRAIPNTMIYSMTNTESLIHHVRNRPLRFLGHILRLPEEEPASRYAFYILLHGNRRPGRSRISYLAYIQGLLGYEEGSIQADQIATLAKDRSAWRSLVVVCSAAEEWWWCQQLRVHCVKRKWTTALLVIFLPHIWRNMEFISAYFRQYLIILLLQLLLSIAFHAFNNTRKGKWHDLQRHGMYVCFLNIILRWTENGTVLLKSRCVKPDKVINIGQVITNLFSVIFRLSLY